MKSFFITIIRNTLRGLARLTIWRYRPGIIGVTGTVGKTSTKLAIQAVLGSSRRVRAAAGNLNNDLGLPLAILPCSQIFVLAEGELRFSMARGIQR
jgi:UDP-N-acetylmuramyl pentapeptide synthase